MSAPQIKRRAFAVWFKDLDRWNVSYFRNPQWKWPQEIITNLGSIARLESCPIATNSAQEKQMPLIAKINFGGAIFLRNAPDYDRYKGRLFVVAPNRIIFSKINARQGCIAWVAPTHPAFAVSSEYPVFIIDETRMNPRFLGIVLRTRPARAQLSGAAAGMAKPRTSAEEFMGLQIPIPPLETQNSIVEEWEKTQKFQREELAQIKTRELQIDADFLAALGLKNPRRLKPRKCLAIWWKDLDRWGLQYNQAMRGSVDLNSGAFPVVELNSVLSYVQYGTSEKANSLGIGVPILRINNVKGGQLNFSKLKHIELAPKVASNLLLRQGDILVIRTSGSRDLVGSCSVFHSQEPFVFASYLIRLRVDNTQANPDFIACFLNSSLGRKQIDATIRQIMQNNINSEELRALKIPLPPLDTQMEIINILLDAREELEKQRISLLTVVNKANLELESALIGTTPRFKTTTA